MKVLVISHMYPSTFSKVYGIFVHKQVKALVNKGVKVKVVSPIPWTPFPINCLSKKWNRYSKISQKMIYEGIEIYYPRYLVFPKILFFASSGERMFNGIQETVRKIYKNFKFDIVHSHDALPDGYAGMEISKKYKKPLIVTIHGKDFQQTIFKNNKCKKIVKNIIDFSAKTIIVSEKLKNIGKNNLKIHPSKMIKISNGINLNDICRNIKGSIGEYRKKRLILSVSYLKKIKGIDLNLQAIAKLKGKYPDIIYLIIGEGKERKQLEKLAKELNLQNMVIFIGEVSHCKAMQYMALCDILSLPSWNESFGVVYIEAMAHGKPVIGCQGEGIEDFVEHEKTGLLVKPRDVDSIVEALDFILSNPDEAKEIGNRARKFILENYTWEKTAEKTIKVYKEVLNLAGISHL